MRYVARDQLRVMSEANPFRVFRVPNLPGQLPLGPIKIPGRPDAIVLISLNIRRGARIR